MGREPSREYQRLMRGYRDRRTRLDVGLPPRLGGQRSMKLRQPDVDEAVGCGVGVTEKIENDRMRPSSDLYLRIAALLGFSMHDLRVGHLDLCGSEPPPAVNTSSPHLQRVVDGQREMMCVVAPDGRVLARNAAFSAMFADKVAPENFWRWALLSDCAREAVLVDWEKDWAPYLLEECRLLFFRYRDHAAVHRLYADLTDDLRLQTLPRVGTDINGRAGSLRHAQFGTMCVRTLAAESEGCRLLTFLTESA